MIDFWAGEISGFLFGAGVILFVWAFCGEANEKMESSFIGYDRKGKDK